MSGFNIDNLRVIFADIIKVVADRLTFPNKFFYFRGDPTGPSVPECISELGLLKHAVKEFKAAFPGDRRYDFIDWDMLVNTVESNWPVISIPDNPTPFVEAAIIGLNKLLRTELCQRGVRSAKLSGELPLESFPMTILAFIGHATRWLAKGGLNGGVNAATSALISQGQSKLLVSRLEHLKSAGTSAALNRRFLETVGRPAASSNMRPLRGGRRTRSKKLMNRRHRRSIKRRH